MRQSAKTVVLVGGFLLVAAVVLFAVGLVPEAVVACLLAILDAAAAVYLSRGRTATQPRFLTGLPTRRRQALLISLERHGVGVVMEQKTALRRSVLRTVRPVTERSSLRGAWVDQQRAVASGVAARVAAVDACATCHVPVAK
jgi:hypothetical protein